MACRIGREGLAIFAVCVIPVRRLSMDLVRPCRNFFNVLVSANWKCDGGFHRRVIVGRKEATNDKAIMLF